jgi:hypothetical protein
MDFDFFENKTLGIFSQCNGDSESGTSLIVSSVFVKLFTGKGCFFEKNRVFSVSQTVSRCSVMGYAWKLAM